MLTGTKLMNELVDELNELKLSTMAAILDDLYHRLGFLEMDEWRVRHYFGSRNLEVRVKKSEIPLRY